MPKRKKNTNKVPLEFVNEPVSNNKHHEFIFATNKHQPVKVVKIADLEKIEWIIPEFGDLGLNSPCAKKTKINNGSGKGRGKGRGRGKKGKSWNPEQDEMDADDHDDSRSETPMTGRKLVMPPLEFYGDEPRQEEEELGTMEIDFNGMILTINGVPKRKKRRIGRFEKLIPLRTPEKRKPGRILVPNTPDLRMDSS